MKILFTRFPLESAFGGAELQTLSLMKGFAERGHAVAFLGSCPVLLDLCKQEDILAAELDIGKPPVTKLGAMTFAWRKQAMKKTLENALAEFGGLDAICMLSMSEKILLTPYAAEKGIKPVWIEHDRIGRWLTSNPWLKHMLDSAKHATTVAVSKLTKKEYVKLGWPEERVVDIVNGVDSKRLESRDSEYSNTRILEYSKLRLGCVARLSEDKGVDLLVEAVKDLPRVDLAIVGKGPLEPSIRAMAERINAQSGRERITIQHDVKSIGDFYRLLDALVLPSSQQDPCPLAPMEAMHLGIPVILTDACGTAGYLRHGEEAIIVRAQSVEALRGAIVSVENDSLRRCLSEQGQKAAQRLFSVDRMVEEYLELLKQQ